MGEHKIVRENRHFGRYLRRIRENRKLSLDAVEEMTMGYPEPVTKSHLSRIENGRAVPTFPRMFALCQVYGVPISSMAERFETDLRRGETVAGGTEPDLIVERLRELRKAGQHDSILRLATSTLEVLPEETKRESDLVFKLTIWQILAMIKLGHYESAKVKSEEVLSRTSSDSEYHLRALMAFVNTSYHLKRFTVALMGLKRLDQLVAEHEWDAPLLATAHVVPGPVYHAVGDLKRAKSCFEESIGRFNAVGDDFEACRARINLGQVLIDSDCLGAARRHLEKGASDASAANYGWLTALANSHLALLHYRGGDAKLAESYALRSNAIARPNRYRSVLFRNVFYLWKLAIDKKNKAAIYANEKTLRALSSRVDDSPELEEFRRITEGGNR